MKTLIIIPAYNEEENILEVYKKVINYKTEHNLDYDIIVINDGSTDKTKYILEKNKINHINLLCNLGIGGAVQTGYKYAYYNNYDIAVQFDGDGQHLIEYVPSIIKPIVKRQVNMVIGSRFIEKKDTFKSTRMRRMGIKIISFFIKLTTGKKIYDTTSGLRAIDKKLIKEFAFNYPVEYPEPVSNAYVLKKGYNVKEVSVSMKQRINGVSSIRKLKNVYYMINVIMHILIVNKESELK